MATDAQSDDGLYTDVKRGVWDEVKPWLAEQEQYGTKEAYLLAEYCTAICVQDGEPGDMQDYAETFKAVYTEHEAGKQRSGQKAVDEFFDAANERLNGSGPLEPP